MKAPRAQETESLFSRSSSVDVLGLNGLPAAEPLKHTVTNTIIISGSGPSRTQGIKKQKWKGQPRNFSGPCEKPL